MIVRKMSHFSDLPFVRKMLHTSDMAQRKSSDLRGRILERMEKAPHTIWTPNDFADLASRASIDKAMQRLAAIGTLRRIDRGLYDQPVVNALTSRPSVPDYREVIRAITRRDKVRYVVDGMTAANDLGLTTAVPARIEVLTDARLKPIKLGQQIITFKSAAPSRLYWADRPAMRVVQALYWLQDILTNPPEQARVKKQLRKILSDTKHGQAILHDLRGGLSALPIWMQEFLRDLISAEHYEH
jgi:hypothetical protein